MAGVKGLASQLDGRVQFTAAPEGMYKASPSDYQPPRSPEVERFADGTPKKPKGAVDLFGGKIDNDDIIRRAELINPDSALSSDRDPRKVPAPAPAEPSPRLTMIAPRPYKPAQVVMSSTPPAAAYVAQPSQYVAVSAGSCGKCGIAIDGEHLRALDRVWHSHHFTCGTCDKVLGTDVFYLYQQKAECPHCHLVRTRCNGCGRSIVGEYTFSKSGDKWHVDCAPRNTCAGCQRPIKEKELTALGKTWHTPCFKCYMCQTPVAQTFAIKEGRPVCMRCNEASLMACKKCNKPITGSFLTYSGEKFHDQCFVCVKCGKDLNTGAFTQVGGQYRCIPCSDR